MTFDIFLQQLLNALQWGSFYALIALGYTMVYGVLLLINFAHGDIFMVGAYLAFFVATFLLGAYALQLPVDLPGWLVLVVTLVVTMALTAGVGVTIERVAYRTMRDRGAPRLYLVITALMVGLLLEYGNLSLLGGRDYKFPSLITREVYRFGDVAVSNVRVIVIVASLVVMAVLWFLVSRTKIGMAMRAVSYDKVAAPLMGIPTNQIIVSTFIIGSSLAAFAAVLYGTAYPILSYDMGVMIGWKAFIAAVVGGIGSIQGAMLGGFILGFTEIFVAAFFPSTLRDLIAFTVLLLLLTIRPRGIFGVARRQKV